MCGAPSASDATQCTHCGARLATIACPSCFGMIFLGSKFCPHCGEKVQRVEEDDDAKRPCPRCKTQMKAVTLGHVKVRECMDCEGLWLDTDTFNTICADSDEQSSMLGILPAAPPAAPLEFNLDAVRYVPCPVCTKLMNRVNFAHGSGIILDICKKDGVWFDRDELRHIVEFVRAGGLERAREHDLRAWEEEKRTREYRMRADAAKIGLDGSATFTHTSAAADFLDFAAKSIWRLL